MASLAIHAANLSAVPASYKRHWRGQDTSLDARPLYWYQVESRIRTEDLSGRDNKYSIRNELEYILQFASIRVGDHASQLGFIIFAFERSRIVALVIRLPWSNDADVVCIGELAFIVYHT